MNLVEAVNILDGNSYIVKPGEVQSANSLEFDSVYNKKCIENNLDELFKGASEKYGIDVNILKAVGFVESTFRTNAVSKSGAMGVMQLMPYTAKNYGVEDPFNAEQNINGGARLLAYLMNKYDGNVTLACAAYNAGSGAVDAAGGVPDKEQVVNYVKKINEVLGGALDNDSWTIEGSSPTIVNLGPQVGKSYKDIVLGSVYAGMVYPSTTSVGKVSDIKPGVSIPAGNAKVLKGIELGNLRDGSAYEHFTVNNRAGYTIKSLEETKKSE
ncbi:MAG: lytic transglycosylase domain-containing protein [Lachnospira sp.]|nr:lytic transglycosylase domain-containing protein [Lachnospira sp.]